MNRLIIILFSISLLITCDDNDSLFGPPEDVQDNIFDHINHFRLINGLYVLEELSELNTLAANHARYMGDNNVVDHYNQTARYNYVIEELSMSRYAELVEAGDLYGRDLIDKWSNDDDATAILLGDYEFIGVGVYEHDDQTYATIIFTK
jgi:uncharacterized protein YkwD